MRIDLQYSVLLRARQRRVMLAMVSLALLLVLLAGCGSSAGDKASGGAADSNAAAKAAVTGQDNPVTVASASESRPNPYEAAGIADPIAFNRMFEQVQAAVAAGKPAEVASFALYPVRVNYGDGQSVQIASKEQFIADYDRIITPSVKEALRTQKLEELFVNAEGVMAGAGQIWFGATASTPQQYGIIAVNP